MRVLICCLLFVLQGTPVPSSDELRKRYGQPDKSQHSPDSERFTIRPGFTLTVHYAIQVIEPTYVSALVQTIVLANWCRKSVPLRQSAPRSAILVCRLPGSLISRMLGCWKRFATTHFRHEGWYA